MTPHRCYHMNGSLYEEYLTASSYLFEQGHFEGGTSDPEGNYTGRIWFDCKDCGKRIGPTTLQSAPLWMRRRYLIATEDKARMTR